MKGHRNVALNATIKQALPCLLAGVITLSGCASTNGGDQKIVASKADPYESANRKIYNFNDKVDNYIAEPISDIYRAIAPQFLQTSVFNFFSNLDNINNILNDFLQGKFQQGTEDTGRLAMNSTLGLLGVFDVAKSVGLQQNNEDFEQTLAVWGVPRGPYLIIPFLGPLTSRGIPGAVFDTAANPSSYVGVPVQLVSLLNKRANAEGSLKFIDEAALDPYVFTRESFLQWRTSLANDGKSVEPADFEDEMGMDDEPSPKGETAMKLGVGAYNDPFKQVSLSFSNTALSFENTANSFKASGKKLDKLKK
ncbi:MAG: VacJ family lipoprotein [Methylovulum sp.]|uniref:MlaA family lipoprotein n=1 Tax=Methylovulum sp. TaxID=1916980 RepID=UPI00260B5CA4|nr:VacJ family lipoprotein [Methylovulum sp.]MDD2725172.1 VacJ family lipoprotein [Methylovulum sp.]MDD5124395.1 VacJ family lipoprotein [Methylovulum sp.]